MKQKSNPVFIPLILISGTILAGGLLYVLFGNLWSGEEESVCGEKYNLQFESVDVCLSDSEDHGFVKTGDESKYESEELNVDNPPSVSLISEEEYRSLSKVVLSNGELATTFEYQELGMVKINELDFIELASGYYPIETVGEEVVESFDEEAATIEMYSYAYILEDGSALLFDGEKSIWEELLGEIK